MKTNSVFGRNNSRWFSVCMSSLYHQEANEACPMQRRELGVSSCELGADSKQNSALKSPHRDQCQAWITDAASSITLKSAEAKWSGWPIPAILQVVTLLMKRNQGQLNDLGCRKSRDRDTIPLRSSAWFQCSSESCESAPMKACSHSLASTR